MRDRLDYAWRVVATGVSFATFGVGGVVMRLLVFPVLGLFVRDPDRRGRLVRMIIHRSFAGFIGLAQSLGVLTWEVRGGERLRRDGLLILVNHPTLLDVVFLIALIPNADCVVKSKLARNPFTRGPVKASGYVCNDSGAGLVADCIASVRSGKNLIIFPEGTRTPRDGRRRLHRGAAHIALQGAINVTLVVIRCAPPTLAKGEPWYRIPPRRFHVAIEVGADLPVAQYLTGTTAAIAARRLTDELAVHFDTGCASAGS
jgi:1-acyl-sn-glycerol-3-phosphate acyltransferase